MSQFVDGTGASDTFRRFRYIFIFICFASLTLMSCVEPRLADPETRSNVDRDEIPTPEPFAGWEYRHEDGNWYAGWARSLSPEMTDEAVVTEDMVMIPRSAANDAGMWGVMPGDILVGASPNTGFLKRVLHVEKDEDSWNIEVIQAQFEEVFLDGDFNFSRDNPEPTQYKRFPKRLLEEAGVEDPLAGELEPLPNAVTTQRQGLSAKADVFKAPFSAFCTSSRPQDCLKGEQGINISATPNIVPREEIDGRMVFRAGAEHAKSANMCGELSAASETFEAIRSYTEERIRNGTPFDEEAQERLKAFALKKYMEWALRWAGHSAFRPYEPIGTGAQAKLQLDIGGTSCNEDRLPFGDPFENEGQSDGEDCEWGSEDFFDSRLDWYLEPNRYYVEQTSGLNYKLFSDNGSHDLSLSRFYNACRQDCGLGCICNWEALADEWVDFWSAGDDRDNARVYHMMRKDFRLATVDMTREIAENPQLAAVYRSNWRFTGDSLGTARHGGEQIVKMNIQRRQGYTAPGDILAPYKLAGRLYSSDLRDLAEVLERQPLVEDLTWLETAVSVGKHYCEGVPSEDLIVGFGAKAQFEWQPKITVEYTREFTGGRCLRRNSETGDCEEYTGGVQEIPSLNFPFVNVPSWFAVGPIPVHATWKMSFRADAKASFAGSFDITFRKYLADIDFFWGIRRDGEGNITPTTPADYAEITGRTVPEGDEGVSAENRLRFFENPDLRSEQLAQYSNSEPTAGGETFLRQDPFFTLGGFKVGAKGELFVGLAGEVKFYGTFGIGTAMGAEADLGLEISGDGLKIEGQAGPRIQLESKLTIPFCSDDCMKSIVEAICGIPLVGRYVCTGGAEADAGFAKLGASGGDLKLEIPILKSCKFFHEDLEKPSCTAADRFNIAARWLPPCVKFCAETNPPSDNDWIAIEAVGYSADPNHPAGIRGIPIDSVVINRSGEYLNPIEAKFTPSGGNVPNASSLIYCDTNNTNCNDGVERNFDECNFDIMNERVVDVENMLFLRFDKLRPGDDLFIIRQNMPPSADEDGRPCNAENGKVRVYLGSMEGDGFWRQIDTLGINQTSAGINIGLSSLAREGDPTTSSITQ